MADNKILHMRPNEVGDATRQINQLADRIEQLMQTEGQHLSVSEPAHDEVSQRVASTLNQVHDDFVDATTKGANQIREIAEKLRSQTDDVTELDDSFGS
jgi:ElaB/YqjD/DUF883 family membrane-anchored ribosome-binding protein